MKRNYLQPILDESMGSNLVLDGKVNKSTNTQCYFNNSRTLSARSTDVVRGKP